MRGKYQRNEHSPSIDEAYKHIYKQTSFSKHARILHIHTIYIYILGRTHICSITIHIRRFQLILCGIAVNAQNLVVVFTHGVKDIIA